jgi:ADP-heptose:LPS heptosyltransferase
MADAVLAIRPRALGDVVLVTPALRALRRGHPDAELEVVTEARYAPLVETLPGVHRVWAMERTHRGTWSLARALRRRRYRVVVDFFGNPRTALLARLCRARARAGYDLGVRRRFYDIVAPREVAPPGRREYAAATHVRLARAAGGVDDGLDTQVALPPDADSVAERLLKAASILGPRPVGLVAAGTWPTKTWPIAHVASFASILVRRGLEVVAIHGPGEARTSEALARLAPGVRLLPPCGVAEMACAVRRLGALVGTDSGPRHLAIAFGVPTFTWFGPTHPDTWSPSAGPHAFWRTDLPCRACDRTRCPHWNCLPGLHPEEAARRVIDHLERHGTAAGLGSAARA